MLVIRNYVFGISHNSTINKFIVINIGHYHIKRESGINKVRIKHYVLHVLLSCMEYAHVGS